MIKVRVKNSNIQKGKSADYRVIYQVESPTFVLLLTIYAKSDRDDISASEILNSGKRSLLFRYNWHKRSCYSSFDYKKISNRKAMTPITFADILETADRLSLQDQEELLRILKNRIRAQKRAILVKAVQEAQQEFEQGNCQPATPEQLMEEILSLPSQSRAMLADKLVESLEFDVDSEIQALWITEAKRRRDEIRNGVIQPVPGEDALAQVRRLISL